MFWRTIEKKIFAESILVNHSLENSQFFDVSNSQILNLTDTNTTARAVTPHSI